MNSKKYIRFIKSKIKIVLILFIVFICASYLNVEVLTYKYGMQFKDLYNASGWIESCSLYKVFKYADDEAEVYYEAFNPNKKKVSATFMYHFKRVDDKWILDSWKCIWSQTGNADEFIWPYYFH